MAVFNEGDKVKIKDRKNWPIPYRFTNGEGTVEKWIVWDELMEEFDDFTFIHLEKAEGDGQAYVGKYFLFPTESLEKI